MIANRPHHCRVCILYYENLRDHSQRDRGNPYLSEPDKSLTFPMALWFPVLPPQETPFCFAGVTEITIMAFLWSDIPFTVQYLLTEWHSFLSHWVTFLLVLTEWHSFLSHWMRFVLELTEWHSFLSHWVTLLSFWQSDMCTIGYRL